MVARRRAADLDARREPGLSSSAASKKLRKRGTGSQATTRQPMRRRRASSSRSWRRRRAREEAEKERKKRKKAKKQKRREGRSTTAVKRSRESRLEEHAPLSRALHTCVSPRSTVPRLASCAETSTSSEGSAWTATKGGSVAVLVAKTRKEEE